MIEQSALAGSAGAAASYVRKDGGRGDQDNSESAASESFESLVSRSDNRHGGNAHRDEAQNQVAGDGKEPAGSREELLARLTNGDYSDIDDLDQLLSQLNDASAGAGGTEAKGRDARIRIAAAFLNKFREPQDGGPQDKGVADARAAGKVSGKDDADKTGEADEKLLDPDDVLVDVDGAGIAQLADETSKSTKTHGRKAGAASDSGDIHKVSESTDKASSDAVDSAISVVGQKQDHATQKDAKKADLAEAHVSRTEMDASVPRSEADGVDLPDDGEPVTSARTAGKSADDGMPAAAETHAEKGKIETVNVLESRRYLGFSLDANTSNLASAIKGDTSWTQALQAAADFYDRDTVKEVNTLKLQLNPDKLGSMVASLALKGDELVVQVQVETAEAYRHLNADKDHIVKALQGHGFSIDQVTVQLSPSARQDGMQDPSSQQQQAGQNLKEGQGDSSRNGQNSAQRQPDAENGTRHDTTTDLSSADRGQSSRTGNLYL